MDLYTAVLRKSGPYWVALCLENGIVGQGYTKEAAIEKLKEAIDSIAEAQRIDSAIYSVLNNPIRKEVQHNGRVRLWAYIPEPKKYLRVVTESDGETVHNAFFDRRFRL